MDVSARVRARPIDFTFDFTSNAKENTIGAEEEIEYTIKYGSLLDYRVPMVIEAEWSLGTVPDQSLYSYNIVSYVAGSATKDYWGESTPVVDTVNRKITWTVKSFPPNTIDKTLRFKLKTPGRYVTDKNVNFIVRARMYSIDTYKSWIALDQTYTPTDFIRKEVRGLQFIVAEVRRITNQSFSLFIVTSVPARTTIYYGLTPEMDQSYTDDTLSDQKFITIDGLLPATTYYYRIMIENEKGIQRKTPEVFTVTTSSTSLVSLIDQERVLISSRGVLLKSTSGLGVGSTIVVPRGVPVELFLPFIADVPSSVYLSLASQSVLGISTEGPPATADQKVKLLETQMRTFTGSITTPIITGIYDMVLEASSDKSGTNQDVVTSLIVSDPISVVNKEGKPIERAIIYLERLNNYTQIYEYFPAESFGSHNPSYTESDGSVDMVLPDGDYTINVNAIGYKTYQSNFYFNPSGNTPYPKIVLERSNFSPLTYLTYYHSAILDSFKFFNFSVDKLASSLRFQDLSMLVAIVIFTILSILANFRRVKVTFEGFLIFIEKRFIRVFRRLDTTRLFIGFVENRANQMPINTAVVLLVDKKTKKIIARDVTNSIGEFHLLLDPGKEYDLVIKKRGFSGYKEVIGVGELIAGHPPFAIHPEAAKKLPAVLEFMIVMIRTVFYGFSDALLFAVGILNILLYIRIGPKVLPVLALTALNAILWAQFQWHTYRNR
ncbi:hypothetical protein ACFL1A_01745 [Patescibacteria group bacterium]